MIDSHGRKIDYMRISVTDRCNLRCQYCMPDNTETLSHLDILRFEEILEICKSAVKLGITKFKITGGEPLIRKGCISFLKELKMMQGVEQVTLTTNGVLLGEYLNELEELKIDGVNISLDTLDSALFARITGKNEFEKVFSAILDCQRRGIRTKINTVLMRETNDDEFLKLVELAKNYKLDVRFIEMMPIGLGKKFLGYDRQTLLEELKKTYPDYRIDTKVHGNGPAGYVKIEGFQGSIGFIDAIHGKFCEKCNRVRLTSDGCLKLCLYYDSGINLKNLIRDGASEDIVMSAMKESISNKPTEHQFYKVAQEGQEETKRMSQIGG